MGDNRVFIILHPREATVDVMGTNHGNLMVIQVPGGKQVATVFLQVTRTCKMKSSLPTGPSSDLLNISDLPLFLSSSVVELSICPILICTLG